MCLVKHPSGDSDAVYQIFIEIVAEVLVFIKDCRALGLRRGDLITLLAGFVPLLQVCVHRVIGRISIRGSRCERSGNNYRIHPLDPYH